MNKEGIQLIITSQRSRRPCISTGMAVL